MRIYNTKNNMRIYNKYANIHKYAIIYAYSHTSVWNIIYLLCRRALPKINKFMFPYAKAGIFFKNKHYFCIKIAYFYIYYRLGIQVVIIINI